MKTIRWTNWSDIRTEQAVVLFLHGKEPGDKERWKSLDEILRGEPGRQAQERGFKGKLGQVLRVDNPFSTPRVLYLVGLENTDLLSSQEALRRGCASLGKVLQQDRVVSIALTQPFAHPLDEETARTILEGLQLSQYRFDRYRNFPESEDRPVFLETTAFCDIEEPLLQSATRISDIFIRATFLARDLVNEPAVTLYPEKLAEIAQAIAHDGSLGIEVYDELALEELGAGALLGVGRGSEHPPRMVHLEYRPPEESHHTLALVGKGITFDSGGLSLKPTKSMLDMKGDMAGAAVVLSVLKAIAQLKPPVTVHGLLCCAENMPSSKAIRPGDILRAINGKTIEITNTDAEGRLVLADGLAFSQRLKAHQIIDIATLTGAAVVALGTKIAAVIGNNDQNVESFLTASRNTGEMFWALPLERAYRSLLDSPIADLRNSVEGGEAGTILGALFLHEFVGDHPWLHLDIAGPFFLEKSFYYLPEGGTGFGVRTLIQYILDKAGDHHESSRGANRESQTRES